MVLWARKTISSIETITTLRSLLYGTKTNTLNIQGFAYCSSSNTPPCTAKEKEETNTHHVELHVNKCIYKTIPYIVTVFCLLNV